MRSMTLSHYAKHDFVMTRGRKTRRDLRAAQVVWRVRWGVCIQLVTPTLVTPIPALPLQGGGRENERAGSFCFKGEGGKTRKPAVPLESGFYMQHDFVMTRSMIRPSM